MPEIKVQELTPEKLNEITSKDIQKASLEDLIPLFEGLSYLAKQELEAELQKKVDSLKQETLDEITRQAAANQKQVQGFANQLILTGDPDRVMAGVRFATSEVVANSIHAAAIMSPRDTMAKHLDAEKEAIERLGLMQVPIGKAMQALGLTPAMLYEKYENAVKAGSPPGSYVVPVPLLSDLLDYLWEENPLLQLATHIPVDTQQGKVPRAHMNSDGSQSTKISRTAEAAAGTEGAPDWDNLSWDAQDVKGHVKVSDNFLQSNIIAFSSWVTLQLKRSVDLFLKNWLINGTGTNQFWGIYTEATTYGTVIQAQNVGLDDFMDAIEALGGDVADATWESKMAWVSRKSVRHILWKRKDNDGKYYYRFDTIPKEIVGTDHILNGKVPSGVCLLVVPSEYLIFENLGLARMIHETGGQTLQLENTHLFGIRLNMDGKLSTHGLAADKQAVVAISGIA